MIALSLLVSGLVLLVPLARCFGYDSRGALRWVEREQVPLGRWWDGADDNRHPAPRRGHRRGRVGHPAADLAAGVAGLPPLRRLGSTVSAR
jgi:hypothetical protein